MFTPDIFALGLGLEAPWKVLDIKFDTESTPNRLDLRIGADRGAMYRCPECGEMCKAHDFLEMTWRHLNFFQHHCYLTASVPRVNCPKHGIHRVQVPWAREGSRFTLLFEQVIMALVREMPVAAVARQVHEHDTRIWRIVTHYVSKAVGEFDLSKVSGIGIDETARSRGHNYVTTFIDMDREDHPVIFCTPGRGRETVSKFKEFLKNHKGKSENIIEVVCDMSPAFLSGVDREFPFAAVTVDWFHAVQHFTNAVDAVRRLEAKKEQLPKGTRWAVLRGDTRRTASQKAALDELMDRGLHTATAFLIKEKMRWVREADSKSAARWRITHFLNFARGLLSSNTPVLQPMFDALRTFENHMERIIARWDSCLTNARMEGMNGLFQAARARARGYRNEATFITMIYLIGAPISKLLWP